MQLELFKEEEIDVYKDIKKVDVADVIDPTTGKLFVENMEKDLYYLYKTGCPHEILKDQGNIFPGVYSVRSKKWLSLHPDPNLYVKFTVDLENKKSNSRKKITLHRIVAAAFIENNDPERKKVVDHKNNRKYDYKLENLRWLTQSENSRKENKTDGIAAKLIQDEIKKIKDNE